MAEETRRRDPAAAVDRRPSEDVFGLLANETRVDILRALGETPDTPLSFSALYDRVDVRDSGNFNYHLDQLLGTFVRKDDAYELTHAGREIVGAMYAGTYTADATVDPIPLDWHCLLCGGRMVAGYEGERAKLVCDDCGKGARFPFPPGSLDQYSRDELPGAFARWLRQLFQQPRSGFCQLCAGRTDGELARLPGGTEDDPRPAELRFECRRCGTDARLSATSFATYHPVVEGFLHEHGFDTFDSHPSRIWGELDAFDSLVLAEDPPRLAVVLEHGGEAVRTEITADATVAAVERYRVD